MSRAATAVSDELMQRVIGHPQIRAEQMISLFDDVLGDTADASFKGFIKVLMHYHRLPLLPEIAEQFEQQRRDSEQRLKVNVTSAVEMQPDQIDRLTERLQKRFGAEIELETTVDDAILGGLVVRAGDNVIDVSVRGRLERLEHRLVR